MPNGDGVLDGDEDHLADAEVGSDRRFSADFTVTSPPFVFGQGRTKNSSANKVNAVEMPHGCCFASCDAPASSW